MDVDPIPLAQALIRCASVTPADAGAQDVLAAALERLGFAITRRRFGEVDNLFAKIGDGRPHLLFAGHTDVVPVGDAGAWSVDPFAAEVRDGMLMGRGAADMKAAIAAMVAGVETHLSVHGTPKGAISFLITGDEEGPAIDGTVKMLTELAAQGERFDHCLVGEPTAVSRVADTLKNGRRGSLNAVITVEGVQGHVAYPADSKNPVGALLDLLAALRARRLDDGAPGFQPSNLEVTTIDVGNAAHNVIPARASAKLNIRFNTAHDGQDLKRWIEHEAARVAGAHGVTIETKIAVTGRAFYTEPERFIALVAGAAAAVTGYPAQLSTSGGTSDARYIKDYCPCAEIGLSNATAHKVDERAPVEEVRTLARIYARVLAEYFA
ncbi:MAG: succinyl-diaminopimelate desuccinylase [Hydrogenophilaceae bacterium]|jgi:succinyl-diaminopimelate desuccinylase|nr:succinyl-diaminopimelate desuccinylase [Hydrogenophilaceae bacterium]